MPVSKAQQKATNKYIAKAYDRVNLTLPKGQKDVIQTHAAARGESVNGFIGRAITEAMERDNGGGVIETVTPVEAPESPSEGVSAGVIRTLNIAAEAAQKPGKTPETVEEFIERAVSSRDESDDRQIRKGVDPVPGWRWRHGWGRW